MIVHYDEDKRKDLVFTISVDDYHRCEYCRFCGPTTTTLTGDGPRHRCWCKLDGIPGPLHDYYGKACGRWEHTTRFDKEETR